ncbi:hypothetical protein CTAYLR_001667 [Chrysophaeum taylorii]|uniref:Uncharacterized protein n=1 Tax=Chrysophaeum taylorii TaxID=2483200 RepID=A0AAD7UBV7_9STRA|nr:hypothetical protein CTAYLR_001667 [Chrysophaeum taylorii]
MAEEGILRRLELGAFEAAMAEVSNATGLPIRARPNENPPRGTERAELFLDKITPKRRIRFVFFNATPARATAVDSAVDGALFAVSSSDDVRRSRAAAIDIFHAIVGPLSAPLAAKANLLKALDELRVLEDVSPFTRPSPAAETALAALDRAATSDHWPDVTRLAVEARLLVARALKDPALALPQHVPREHLVAIYAPLVAPLVLPLLSSLRSEYRRYIQRIRK